MFQFTQPIWLYAIGAIAIPVAIHLWNVRQGKTLRVGSISLVEQSSRQTSRNLKLTELLLLLLRCFLIVLLAFLLAKPSWNSKTNNDKGWILIEKNQVQTAYNQQKVFIDSLLGTGFSFHYFDNDFEEVKFTKALKENPDTSFTEERNYWNAIQKLDERLPDNSAAFIFAPNLLYKFSGNRPVVQHEINWRTIATKRSDTTQIANAWLTLNDSLHIITAKNNDSATKYQNQIFKIDDPLPLDYQLLKENSNTTIGYKNQPAFVVDTAINTITIFEDKNTTDAGYLLAALHAIQSFTGRNINTKLVDNLNNIPARQNWLFWLSDKNIPAGKVFENLFQYASGEQQIEQSWITSTGNNIPANIALRKRIQFKPADYISFLWQDGYGQPLLTEAHNGDHTDYRFYSRLNASWNDLAWSAYFPSLLMELVLKNDIKKTEDRTIDRRLIDPAQLQFKAVNNKGLKNRTSTTKTDLLPVLWLFVMLFFLLERWFSFQSKKAITA